MFRQRLRRRGWILRGYVVSDGFEDPIFLWDEDARTLHLRLFIVGRTERDIPIVRRIESVMFLRNENFL